MRHLTTIQCRARRLPTRSAPEVPLLFLRQTLTTSSHFTLDTAPPIFFFLATDPLTDSFTIGSSIRRERTVFVLLLFLLLLCAPICRPRFWPRPLPRFLVVRPAPSSLDTPIPQPPQNRCVLFVRHKKEPFFDTWFVCLFVFYFSLFFGFGRLVCCSTHHLVFLLVRRIEKRKLFIPSNLWMDFKKKNTESHSLTTTIIFKIQKKNKSIPIGFAASSACICFFYSFSFRVRVWAVGGQNSQGSAFWRHRSLSDEELSGHRPLRYAVVRPIRLVCRRRRRRRRSRRTRNGHSLSRAPLDGGHNGLSCFPTTRSTSAPPFCLNGSPSTPIDRRIGTFMNR